MLQPELELVSRRMMRPSRRSIIGISVVVIRKPFPFDRGYFKLGKLEGGLQERLMSCNSDSEPPASRLLSHA